MHDHLNVAALSIAENVPGQPSSVQSSPSTSRNSIDEGTQLPPPNWAGLWKSRPEVETPGDDQATSVSSNWHSPSNEKIYTPALNRYQSFSTEKESTSCLIPSYETPELSFSSINGFLKRSPDYQAIALARSAREHLSAEQKAQWDAELKEALHAKVSFPHSAGELRDVVSHKRAWRGSATSLSTIHDLLERGASMSDDQGFDAVKYEIKNSARPEVIELLLVYGADISRQDGEFGDALQTACARPNPSIEVVQLLLNWGADVNAQGWYYGDALQLALVSGSTELVRLLLRYGAKHSTADEQSAIYKNPYMGTRKKKGQLVGLLAGRQPEERRKSEGHKLDFLTGRPSQR